MTKTKIDAGMIERARIAAMKANEPFNTQFTVAFFMTVLDAALNPPPAPEIPVSRGMIVAGQTAHILYNQDVKGEWILSDEVAMVYRAMEAKRREETDAPSQPLPLSQGICGSALERLGPDGKYWIQGDLHRIISVQGTQGKMWKWLADSPPFMMTFSKTAEAHCTLGAFGVINNDFAPEDVEPRVENAIAFFCSATDIALDRVAEWTDHESTKWLHVKHYFDKAIAAAHAQGV